MHTERSEKNSPHSWDELSPELREAVGRVCSEPMPKGFAQRALAVARGSVASQSAGRARFSARRQVTPCRVWAMRVTAAAIAVAVVLGFSWTVKVVNTQVMRF